jgi:hypothetical protein
MKNLIFGLFFVISVSASNVQEWKPKYQLKKLDGSKARIAKPRQSSSKNDRVKLKSSSIQKTIPRKKMTTPPAAMMSKQASNDMDLEQMYRMKYKTKGQYQNLKKKTMALTQKAVPTLVKVIKSSDYPDKNRWIAMFMLGRIMGKKSAKFVSKFANHPNWMLRLSSLKVLLALDQKQYKGLYTIMLKDKAMIVRHQALENIKQMNLKELAPFVWAMLYDKTNYAGSEGVRKRSSIIREAIRTVGDLKFEKSREPMLKMIQNKKYKDIFVELDYSLNKVSKEQSPADSMRAKRHFWNKLYTKNVVIN